MFRYVVALSALALLSACGSSSPSSPSNPTATTVNMPVNAQSLGAAGYVPDPVTVAAGTTITWTNSDMTAHTVTSDTPGLFSSGTITGGGTFSTTLQSRGTVTYHCTFHAGMVGTIIVQ